MATFGARRNAAKSLHAEAASDFAVADVCPASGRRPTRSFLGAGSARRSCHTRNSGPLICSTDWRITSSNSDMPAVNRPTSSVRQNRTSRCWQVRTIQFTTKQPIRLRRPISTVEHGRWNFCLALCHSSAATSIRTTTSFAIQREEAVHEGPVVYCRLHSFGHAIDDVGASTSGRNQPIGSFTGDFYNRAAAKATSDFDRKHRIVASYVYQIPGIYENSCSSVRSVVLSGWDWSPV